MLRKLRTWIGKKLAKEYIANSEAAYKRILDDLDTLKKRKRSLEDQLEEERIQPWHASRFNALKQTADRRMNFLYDSIQKWFDHGILNMTEKEYKQWLESSMF